MTRFAFFLALLFTAPWEAAETVDVRDRGPVDLASFNCQDITRSSVIGRVCYDGAGHRMLVQRLAVYHQYCGVPQDSVDALLNARSMGQYFNVNIAPASRDRDGPYDCRPAKAPSYQ